MTTAAQLAELCSSKGTVSFGRASQEELDQIGLLLDRLEELEIYLDTNLCRKERADALAEFETLTDRITTLIEKV
jgi:hypothetical protein